MPLGEMSGTGPHSGQTQPRSDKYHHRGTHDQSRRHSITSGFDEDYNGKHSLDSSAVDNQLIGGYDATPIPFASHGYTFKFTFHRAENLPRSDLSSKASDPYLTATLTSDLPKRHESDPDVMLRTPTVHDDLNPIWNLEWFVAGIPISGFKLKCRLYDEDQANKDDRLGNVTIFIDEVKTGWPGIKCEPFIIKKRAGSRRAYLFHGCTAIIDPDVDLDGYLFLSAELLGISEKPHGRMYTIGLTSYFKHYSPLIGILVGTKVPVNSEVEHQDQVERFDFQANQFQLKGPVPAELYHRFVEFKPFVRGMFDRTGLRGRVLNTVLHHQHARIYNYSNSTEYGVVDPCSEEAAMQFLKMVHFDDGRRTFTYILSLDGLLRFTETGKEFGIDLLSKHTMHSNVSSYIAFSGEFIVKRRRHQAKADQRKNSLHSQTYKDIGLYKLIIDNDSGTYRPNGDLLPLLKEFLNKNFPGLRVITKECTDEDHISMKKEQRERKKEEGRHFQMVQHYDSEVSSSDEEDLAKRRDGMKSKREQIFSVLEDPKKAIKELIHRER